MESSPANTLGKVLHETVIPSVRQSLADGEQERLEREMDAAFEILDGIIESLPVDPNQWRQI